MRISTFVILLLTAVVAVGCMSNRTAPTCAQAAEQAGMPSEHISILEKDDPTAQEQVIVEVLLNAYELEDACTETPAERPQSDAISNEEIVATIQAALSSAEARDEPAATPTPTPASVQLDAPVLAQVPTSTPIVPTQQTAPTAPPLAPSLPAPTSIPSPTPTAAQTPTPFPPTNVASGTNASMSAQVLGTRPPETYAQCIDRTDAFIGGRMPENSSVPAIILRCMDYPAKSRSWDVGDCVATASQLTEIRYPNWSPTLVNWYSVRVCHDPSAEFSVPVGITTYGACMNLAYEDMQGRFRDQEIDLHGMASLCAPLLPSPEPNWYDLCFADEREQARSVYPNWPTLLRDWHAAIICVPHWEQAESTAGGDVYGTCLSDVQQQSAGTMPEQIAVAAAVWRCREHEPAHTGRRAPGCLDRAEYMGRELPPELDTWYKVGYCLWPW